MSFPPISALITQAANARNAYTGGQRSEQDQSLQNALLLRQLQSQDASQALAQRLGNANIEHLKSQSEGQWGQAFPGVVKGQPTMLQQHKLTGEVREAKLGESAPPPTAAAPSASSASPPLSMAGVGDSQHMDGESPPSPTPSLATKLAQQGGTGGTGIAPYVKPARPPAERPASMIPGTPEWEAAQRTKAKIAAQYAQAPVQSIQVLPGSEGKPAQGVVTSSRDATKLGTTVAIPDVDKTAGGRGGAGSPQQKASLEAGLRTLESADRDATAYEDKLLAQIHSGKSPEVGGIAGTLGAFADPSKHPDLAPAAGGILNSVNGDYAKYTKSLTSAANAGMLISQRPSDMRAKKEQFLAGVSTNPTEDLIQQARQWRADMKAAFQTTIRNGVTPPSGGGRGGAAPSSGNINLAKPSEAEWAKQNPAHLGESYDAYEARYRKAVGGE